MGRTPGYAISELEYLALPPVLRRKFFSSLERLRLEKDGCGPCSTASCPRRPSIVGARATSVLTEVFALSSTFRPGLHKRGLTPADRQLNRDTAAWFRSLPPAVRRKQFSREEQIIFASGRHCIIVDAADEVVDRRCHNRRPFAPRTGHLDRRTSRRRLQDDHFYFSFDSSDAGSDEYDSSVSSDEEAGSCSSSSSSCYSRDLDDVDDIETVAWSVDSMDSMADYSIDSFCFLEDEPELDLKLDDYHQAIQETATSQTSTLPRRSAARNLSLSSTSLRKSSLSSQTMALSSRSYTSSMLLKSPPSPTFAPRAVGPVHRARPSTASIERQAMFYQDPAARMQLRLYLASPSKFDEAVEFGFPSLQDVSEVKVSSTVPSEAAGVQEADEAKGTFLNDDTPSLFNDDDEDGELADELDKWNDPTTPEEAEFKRESSRLAKLQTPSKARVAGQSYTQWQPLGREMTIHMTLTRPDLRSPEEMERLGINARPIERAALPPCDTGASVWDPQQHEGSRMRKMWNKLRAR